MESNSGLLARHHVTLTAIVCTGPRKISSLTHVLIRLSLYVLGLFYPIGYNRIIPDEGATRSKRHDV